MNHYDFSHVESINDSIRALYSKLGNPRIMTFNHDFNNPDFLIQFRQDAANVQHLARVVAEHYRLSIRTILVRFKDLEGKTAQVKPSSSSDFVVDINYGAVQDSIELLAVLAHEITHIFLHIVGLSFQDTMKNEILTDTAATYLGLGNIILNAYSKRQKTLNKKTIEFSSKWFGYLTPMEYGYIIAKRTKKFNGNPIPFLNAEASEAFRYGMVTLESEYRLPPMKESFWSDKIRYRWHRRCAAKECRKNRDFHKDYGHLGYKLENCGGVYVVFQCRSCLQLLRIPAFRGLISVHCPRCESEYQCTS